MGWGKETHPICVALWVLKLKAENLEFLNLKDLSFSRVFFFPLENGDALNCVQAKAQMMPG